MSVEGHVEGAVGRLRRVEELYHELVQRPPGERGAVLAAACPDDPALAAEVQSLLDQPESAAGPLAALALQVAARLFSGVSAALNGKRMGAFEVQSLLGVGGMGEVYRAHDTKLGRDVAIKVLPASVANDPERLARFKREARVLAALNHPNIAAIHGLEEADGRMFLVMELVEGEDLAGRLRRGSIPVREAIAVARQIAEGLEEAHEKGIVHRDLKPANIKVTPHGKVKVLDFGLAKAYASEKNDESRSDVSQSPPRSQPTKAGMVLGTAAYMAPEQARGAPVDRRADIWSFGVVLFEMLTGEWLFKGETPSDSSAAVLKTEPEWTRLPADTPRSVSDLLRRCLDRDPKRRLQSIGEARIVLADPPAMDPSRQPAAVGRGPGRVRGILPWVLTAASTLALVGTIRMQAPPRSPSLVTPRTLLAHIGADASLSLNWGAAAILSPDGTTLVFVADQGGQARLFVRGLDQVQARPLQGTEGAANPFLSPDGRHIGFFADGKLKRTALSGGPVVALCDAPRGRGGAWTEDGTIVFVPSISDPFQKISAAGGTPAPLKSDGADPGARRWPQALPGGRGILYTFENTRPEDAFEAGRIMVAPLTPGPPKVVATRGYYARYLPTGHLIFMQQGKLVAVRFDLDRLESMGPAVPVLDTIATNRGSGGAQFAFAADGTLVYVPMPGSLPINWMTRDGRTYPLRSESAEWASPRFSPDGSKVALDIFDGRQWDIGVYDLARDAMTQLTFDPANDREPEWSPDGRRILFTSDRGQPGITNLYWTNADGTNAVARLTRGALVERVGSWHPRGKWISYWVRDGAARRDNWDLMVLPLRPSGSGGLAAGEPKVYLRTPATETRPAFSPDGRWVAYVSGETGVPEVYVGSFPAGGKWRVSTRGGQFPRWSRNSRELFFLDIVLAKVMVSRYDIHGDSFVAGAAELWSPTAYRGVGTGDNYPYDVHPDGKRIATATQPQDHVVFFLNFFDYLKQVVPENQGSRP